MEFVKYFTPARFPIFKILLRKTRLHPPTWGRCVFLPSLPNKAFIKDQTEPDRRKEITMEEYDVEVDMEEHEAEIVDQSTVADIDPSCEANELEERRIFLW